MKSTGLSLSCLEPQSLEWYPFFIRPLIMGMDAQVKPIQPGLLP